MLLKRSISCNRITERLNASIKVTKYTEERTQDLLCWTWTLLFGVKALWFSHILSVCLFVLLSVGLSACLSVEMITKEHIDLGL